MLVPKVLSFANQKGGVGKTTITAHMAYALTLLGQKVLIIDNDPQGNLTRLFGIDIDEDCYTVEEAYIAKKMPSIDEMAAMVRPKLYIMASSKNLLSLQAYVEAMKDKEERLEKFIRHMNQSTSQAFDWVLIDNPPAMNFLTTNALIASDFLIIPSLLEEFSFDGVSKMMESLAQFEKINKKLKLLGILLNRYEERKNLSKTILSKMEEAHWPILKQKLPISVKVGEGILKYQLVFERDKNGMLAQQFENLAQDLLKMSSSTSSKSSDFLI